MRLSIGEIAGGCMSWLCRPGGWIPVWWCEGDVGEVWLRINPPGWLTEGNNP